MNMDIRIGRFEARYRLPRGLESEADRLDRTLAAMFGEPLERALELAGVREDEELCIRHLHVPVRIHAGATDAAVETEWVLALARAFERARQTAEQHDGSETFLALPERDESTVVDAKRHRPELDGEEESAAVVRYRSRHAALLDMAVRIARGDLSREWAWKQIGPWPHSASSTREAAGYLVEAMLSDRARSRPCSYVWHGSSCCGSFGSGFRHRIGFISHRLHSKQPGWMRPRRRSRA